jgi:hypothetical protein
LTCGQLKAKWLQARLEDVSRKSTESSSDRLATHIGRKRLKTERSDLRLKSNSAHATNYKKDVKIHVEWTTVD